jgi:hypothetical protein
MSHEEGGNSSTPWYKIQTLKDHFILTEILIQAQLQGCQTSLSKNICLFLAFYFNSVLYIVLFL